VLVTHDHVLADKADRKISLMGGSVVGDVAKELAVPLH
jgi:predicted ABC-type transport system involved in lysophospholipase L1 biosynthesis ATPase subunit